MDKTEDNIRIFTKKTDIEYIDVAVLKKKVKNLNLRVSSDGTVKLSIPMRTARKYAENFLLLRRDWIYNAVKKAKNRPVQNAEKIPPEQARAVLQPLVEKLAPDFEKYSGVRVPAVRYRDMKSMWGVCYPKKQCITLNTRLARLPMPLAEYVVLHELVHFIHPDHSARFHAEMLCRMPDYKQRRRELKLYN